jgi:AraC-like DNA-binding protein
VSLRGHKRRAPIYDDRVERCGSIDSFLADPVGRFVATERVTAWCAAPDLLGAAAWDEPAPADVDFLVAAWDRLVAVRTERFDKVFDVRFVSRIREDTFAQLVERVRMRQPVPREVRKQVLLAPGGVASAVVHGFWNLVPSRHEWHVTDDDVDGFAWLERSELRAGVAAIIEHLREGDPLARLRRWLALNLTAAELDAAAAAIGLAPRSLQRHLRDTGTTFRNELRVARLDEARRLLSTTDTKIDAIAAAVGCESSSSFVRLFREAHGETPAVWRERHREPTE